MSDSGKDRFVTGNDSSLPTTVLAAVHYPVFGGPHNQVLQLAKPLAARGIHTLAVLPDEPGNAAARLRGAGIDVVTLPLHRLRSTRNPTVHAALVTALIPEVLALRRLIRRHGVDLVQVGGLVNPHAAIAAALCRKPVVWQVLDTRTPWPVTLGAMMAVRALGAVVMSTGTKILGQMPLGPGSLPVVPFFPPVDPDRFRASPKQRAALRIRWAIPADAPVVGCVANINPQKGILELIESFRLVRDRFTSARLIIVGAEYDTHQEYSAAIRTRIAALGMREGVDVMILGERSDVDELLPCMDVVALAAARRSEGTPTALIEAMACGIPVVATDVGGISDIVDDGRTGRLVPPDRPDVLGAALIEILTNPDQARAMGVAARQQVLDTFSIDRCVEAHINAYSMALATRPSRRAGAG